MAFSRHLVVILGLAFVATQAVVAYDPTILTDFGRVNASTGEDFTDRTFEADKLPSLSGAPLKLVQGFLGPNNGLTGLGLATLYFIAAKGGEVPPHHHSRASELFFVLTGYWTVGFVDTSQILYTSNLGPGDQFVFPIGCIHFQVATSSSATGISVFNSASPGLQLTFSALFSSTPPIPDQTLATAANVSTYIIQTIKNAHP